MVKMHYTVNKDKEDFLKKPDEKKYEVFPFAREG